eukprot:TRINITY_DN3979_c0_g1_i1.p1 TRINITY_DN3979_c0_g1~~TRINITY_DN3979_c0_g1_i1.p1  ORF type:complete len:514 (+),score=81.57 TRINITY_DN3979_c0_g1_i1:171-1712(+)
MSAPYNDDTFTRAKQYVAAMAADLGGTEILRPLQEILSAKSYPRYPRQVFVLTDGEVSNTKAVLSYLRKYRSTTRVFSFGIGDGASKELCWGMARATDGDVEFVTSNANITEIVMRQLTKALQPALTNITVDWGNLAVTQAPKTISALFNGGRKLVYGFVNKKPSEATYTVKMSCDGPFGKVVTSSARLDFSTATTEKMISRMAAKWQIEELENNEADGQQGSHKSQIVALGTKLGLVSKYTSYVVVEQDRTAPVFGAMKLRKVTASMQQGWAPSFKVTSFGFGGNPMSNTFQRVAAPVSAISSSSAFGATGGNFGFGNGSNSTSTNVSAGSFGGSVFSPAPTGLNDLFGATSMPQPARQTSLLDYSPSPTTQINPFSAFQAPQSAPMQQQPIRNQMGSYAQPIATSGGLNVDGLIMMQSASGSWALDAALITASGWNEQNHKSAMQRYQIAQTQVWATLVALAILQRRFASSIMSWNLIATKARNFIRSHSSTLKDDNSIQIVVKELASNMQ